MCSQKSEGAKRREKGVREREGREVEECGDRSGRAGSNGDVLSGRGDNSRRMKRSSSDGSGSADDRRCGRRATQQPSRSVACV